MFLRDFFSWWYFDGLLSRMQMIKNRLKASADFFSVGLLISTLFAPFRQISAEVASGSLSIQMRAFFDKLLSRFIGAFIRFFLIILGLITMLIQIISGIIVLVFWLIIPLFPVAGLIAMVIGWVPRWLI